MFQHIQNGSERKVEMNHIQSVVHCSCNA